MTPSPSKPHRSVAALICGIVLTVLAVAGAAASIALWRASPPADPMYAEDRLLFSVLVPASVAVTVVVAVGAVIAWVYFALRHRRAKDRSGPGKFG
jgi:heme/copper-type cytochrome/quinol oxidase subunit 2